MHSYPWFLAFQSHISQYVSEATKIDPMKDRGTCYTSQPLGGLWEGQRDDLMDPCGSQPSNLDREVVHIDVRLPHGA